MKLLPYQSWKVESPLSVDKLILGLMPRIDKRKIFLPFFSGHASLKGEIYTHGFTVSRIIWYGNPCQPVLSGRFTPTENGTTINIIMTLHSIVLAFLLFWLGMVSLFVLIPLVDSGSLIFLQFSGAMALFAVLLTYVGFWAEAGKTKKLFSQVLHEIHEKAANNSTQGP